MELKDEKLPIEASAGGDNSELVSCPIYNASRHYCVCLKVISHHGTEAERSTDRSCHAALNSNQCPADEMRQNEVDAGEALYYDPRKKANIVINGVDHGPAPSHLNPSFDRAYTRTDRILKGLPPRPKSVAEIEGLSGKKPSRKRKKVAVKPVDISAAGLVNKLMEEND